MNAQARLASTLLAAFMLPPVAAGARREPPRTSPWCAPAPDGLPAREMTDRVLPCLDAGAALMREFARMSRAMAEAAPGGDSTRLREASDHTDAAMHAVEAGCPSEAEVASLSPASRQQVAEWCERGDARALGRVRELLRLLPPPAGRSGERP